MSDMIIAARRLGIDTANIVAFDGSLIGRSDSGRYYLHRDGQWRRLIESARPGHTARRLVRYSGHVERIAHV